MNNVYKKAIKFFFDQGKTIKNISNLIVRGSSNDTKRCIPHWSDVDLSIIVEKIDIEVYDQVRTLYEKMREKFPFKISITLVTTSDFHSYRHHHGTKPIFYNLSLQRPTGHQITTNQFNNYDIHELKYDCFYNIVSLMHDLRIEDMKRDSDLTSMQKFCCQLLKSSNHLIRNSIFIKTGYMHKNINTKQFRACFSNIDPNLLQRIKYFKRNWSSIIGSYEELMKIRDYVLPIISDIYDQVVTYFSKINYKIIAISNFQEQIACFNTDVDKGSSHFSEIQYSNHKTR